MANREKVIKGLDCCLDVIRSRQFSSGCGFCPYADAEHCKVKMIEDTIALLKEQAPTVPTVPLDKLCEFLVKCGADSYCGTCKQIMGECFTNGHGCGSEHFWKELLTKWMEGLDAAD